MLGYVYLIKNTVNSKVYVGKTTRTPTGRFLEHCTLNSGCLALSAAIQKYGKEKFYFEIALETSSREELNVKENSLILELNSLSPNGYNLRLGGNDSAVSNETRQKMSNSAKKKFESQEARNRISIARKGFPVSQETRLKISLSKKGMSKSEETKKRMSDAWRGIPKPKSKDWCLNQSIKMTGKVHSVEARAKMSERKKKKIICNETKQIYPSILEASNLLGCHVDNLRKHLSGKYKMCKGLTFSFFKEISNES